MFMKDTWYMAGWSTEVTSERPLGRTICEEKVVLFRDLKGMPSALEDRCSHRGLPLSCGRMVEGEIECGYHGLVFNGGGTCTRIPGQKMIPARGSIRSFPLVERDGILWVWLGTATDADPAQIPDNSWRNDAVNWPHREGMCYVESNYLLVVDNLMDLSHIGFVHMKTIGGNAPDHVNARTRVERLPTGVRLTRLMLEAVPPPTYLKGVPFTGKIDRWQDFELVAPSNVLQWSGGVDAGAGIEDPSRRVGGVQVRIFHGITPETEKTSFYFWSVGHGHCKDIPAVTEKLRSDIDATIQEDADVLREQELNLAHYPESAFNYIDIESDNARLQARRFIQKRIEAEALARVEKTA